MKGKILRVDMTSLATVVEDIRPDYAGLGGRGLTSSIVAREVPPHADPLGPANKLIFAGGIAAGTTVPCNGRLSVGAKSPLTNGIKEANAGGSAAQKMAKLGFRAFVVEGAAQELMILKIDRNGATFIPASSFEGLGNYELIKKIRLQHGEGVSVISIGPAGEKRLKAAAVMATSPDFEPRAAARGGMGAVMGSKNLKAIVVDDSGTNPVEVADRAKLKDSVAPLSQAVLSTPVVGMFRELGTSGLVMMINSFGCLPTKNYSMGQFQRAEKISGENMAEIIKKRPNGKNTHRCMDGCIVGCSNVYTDEKGETIVSGLEYETIVLTGSNCMIDDIDAVARINRACNDLGLDTMDIGAAIAVAMEAGVLKWGDGAAALGMVEEIRTGSERGMMIGNGCRDTGERLGVKRVPHVKGQGLSAYDPRGLKGIGVTYASSPMGADHTAGIVLPNPGTPDYNPVSPTGQAEPSQFIQTYMAAVDTLGICMMVGLGVLSTNSVSHLTNAISAITGESLGRDYVFELGASVLKTEALFNRAAGMTEKDNRLPKFFSEEALSPAGLVFDVPEEEIDKVNKY